MVLLGPVLSRDATADLPRRHCGRLQPRVRALCRVRVTTLEQEADQVGPDRARQYQYHTVKCLVSCLTLGSKYIYQAMPRWLTVFMDFGTHKELLRAQRAKRKRFASIYLSEKHKALYVLLIQPDVWWTASRGLRLCPRTTQQQSSRTLDGLHNVPPVHLTSSLLGRCVDANLQSVWVVLLTSDSLRCSGSLCSLKLFRASVIPMKMSIAFSIPSWSTFFGHILTTQSGKWARLFIRPCLVEQNAVPQSSRKLKCVCPAGKDRSSYRTDR